MFLPLNLTFHFSSTYTYQLGTSLAKYNVGTITVNNNNTFVPSTTALPVNLEVYNSEYENTGNMFLISAGGAFPLNPNTLVVFRPALEVQKTTKDAHFPDKDTQGNFSGSVILQEDDGSGTAPAVQEFTVSGTVVEGDLGLLLGKGGLLGSAADPATPATQIIDFSQAVAQKNKTGLAYMFGVTSQYVMQSGMTVGLSLNYGKTGSTSNIDYAAGSISGTSFNAADNIRISTKDTGFVSELIQLGWAYHRFNPYIIFGLAQHRAKMFCPDAYQNTGSTVTKGYNTPVFGLGINVAVTKNVYLNFQWQRHMGGVKSWGNIENIIPQGRLAMGSPQSRMGNTMILFGVSCVTNFNGRR